MGKVLDYIILHWRGILICLFFVMLAGILLYGTYNPNSPDLMTVDFFGGGREY